MILVLAILLPLFFLPQPSWGQWERYFFEQRPRTPKTLIEHNAETFRLGIQSEILQNQRIVQEDCLSGVRRADREFEAGISEGVGSHCYHERWADLTRPVYRRGPPSAEEGMESFLPPPDASAAFVRKVIEDHRNKTVDPAFSSWSKEEKEKYAAIWNQEEKIVAEEDKTGIVLSP